MKKFLFIAISLALHLVMHGQVKPFFWENDSVKFIDDTIKYETNIYGTQNGLPSSEISCLAQDSKGYVWIGTSAGLSRYDGIRFVDFLKTGDKFTGKIYAVKEDTLRKIIWIACDGGLFYFSNNQLHATHFKEHDVTFYDISFLHDKDMWLATGEGPAFLSGEIITSLISEKKIALFPFLLPEWKTASPNVPVYKITNGQNGKIYFAGAGTVFRYNNKKLELIWSSSHEQNNNDNIVAIVQGKGDSIFFATVFSGFFSVSKKGIINLPSKDHVVTDLIKHNDQIYYFTSAGIFQFFSSKMQMKKISEVPENLNVWISCLLVDNENNLWIGMHDNLLYQKPKIFFNYRNNSFADPELYSVFQKKNNQILFGANRGKVYKKEGTLIENMFGTEQLVPHAEIKSIYEDSRNWLWFGTGYEGIALTKNNKIFHFTKSDGLSNNSNYFFFEDGEKNIYTGGDGGFSKISYDSLSASFHFKNFYYQVAGDNIETFKNCVEGPDNSLWLVGQMGIFHLKNDSLSRYTIDEDKNINVTDIKKDQSGNVWLTTKGNGLLQCYFNNDNKLQLKKVFTEKEGLLSDIYLGITIDHENNIWAGSYSGVTSIKNNGKNFEIANYTSSDGFLSSNYQSLRIFCDNNDTVWVVTSSGFTSFYARNTFTNKKLLLNFTYISLSDTSKKIAFYKMDENAITTFPYFLNGIEFHFKGICLSDPQKIKYSYRLLGLEDTAWMEWDNKEVAFYQNLSPGNYSFEVKASLDNNNVTKPIIFSFVIGKPFWFRSWFIILSSLFIILIIGSTVKKWKKNVHKKNEEKIKTQKLISENLQYQLEVEQVTNYFATSMSTSETVDDLLWNVARQCISKMNFEDCVIYLIEDKTKTLIQKAAWGPKSSQDNQQNAEANKILSPIEIPIGKGIVGAVASSGIAEIIPDVTKDARYIKDDVQRFSEIAVPIIYNKNVLGIIDSESHQKKFYSQRHLQILTAIASHCAERIVKLKADEELRMNELELLQTKNRLAEEKLTALRSQMNPHFIFNCLNSIQQYILKGEVDNANKYLSQFSKLIRLVLQYSEFNFISLEDEINMLKLYLSLEKIRFGNSFEYIINIEEELDAEEIKIPNLMVQPFVENAIWHGLMHKEGDRKIEIKFTLKNDQSVVCEITDNGIGRKKAEEIKKMKSLELKHDSKGMQLVKDKIDVLKQQFKSEIFIELFDLADSNDEICGTKVVIQLPLQYQEI